MILSYSVRGNRACANIEVGVVLLNRRRSTRCRCRLESIRLASMSWLQQAPITSIVAQSCFPILGFHPRDANSKCSPDLKPVHNSSRTLILSHAHLLPWRKVGFPEEPEGFREAIESRPFSQRNLIKFVGWGWAKGADKCRGTA